MLSWYNNDCSHPTKHLITCCKRFRNESQIKMGLTKACSQHTSLTCLTNHCSIPRPMDPGLMDSIACHWGIKWMPHIFVSITHSLFPCCVSFVRKLSKPCMYLKKLLPWKSTPVEWYGSHYKQYLWKLSLESFWPCNFSLFNLTHTTLWIPSHA